MAGVQIREILEEDRAKLAGFFTEQWGSPQMVYSKGIHQCDQLPGVIALEEERIIGLLTYEVKGDEFEIVSLDSLREGVGLGTQLIAAAEATAQQLGLRRVWLITTNDNLNALRFYQKRGYELVQIYRHAVDQARQIKPQIPLVGDHGIPIRDEIELEKGVGSV